MGDSRVFCRLKLRAGAEAAGVDNKEGLIIMYLSRMLRCLWLLLALAPLVGACALVVGAQGAGAASVGGPHAARPLVGCAPCVSSLDPAQNGTVRADASGKVKLTFGAQMTSPFVKFVLTLDGTAVDSTKIQVTSNDPLQPSGSYTAVLAAGQHTATVEVDDANGPEATFPGWSFTVQAAPVTPTPTRTPASNSGGNGSNPTTTTTPGTSSSSGLLSPKALSIILFSVAGVGLLVMAFIAGMWFSGRRALRNLP
jgi:hypothetical protein